MNRRFVYATLILAIIVLLATYWFLGKDTSPEGIEKVRNALLVCAGVGLATLAYKHFKFTERKREIASMDDHRQALTRSDDAIEDGNFTYNEPE